MEVLLLILVLVVLDQIVLINIPTREVNTKFCHLENVNSLSIDFTVDPNETAQRFQHQQYSSGRNSSGQYSPSPCPSTMGDLPPPTLPRCTSSTPPTPPPVPPNLQQLFKRISPGAPPTRAVALPSQSPARGTSPVSNNNHRPVIAQNGPNAQQQLSQQMQALSLYQTGGNSGEPPPPYPIISTGGPPSYTTSIQNRQSPTQSNSDYRKSPSSGIYSATSTSSPSPITVSQNSISPYQQIPRPIPVPQRQTWQKTKSHTPVIMQSVKSTQVQKPVLQTAIAPPAPPVTQSVCASPVHVAPPSYASSIQQRDGPNCEKHKCERQKCEIFGCWQQHQQQQQQSQQRDVSQS